MGLTSFGMLAAADIGPLVVEILTGGGYAGKTVSPAGDKLCVGEMAAILSTGLRCYFRDRQVRQGKKRKGIKLLVMS